MSSGHQRIKWRRNIAENFNRLSSARTLQTDGRRTTYSEDEHEFTFAKKHCIHITKLFNHTSQFSFDIYVDKYHDFFTWKYHDIYHDIYRWYISLIFSYKPWSHRTLRVLLYVLPREVKSSESLQVIKEWLKIVYLTKESFCKKVEIYVHAYKTCHFATLF